jgi:hypothetical protein
MKSWPVESKFLLVQPTIVNNRFFTHMLFLQIPLFAAGEWEGNSNESTSQETCRYRIVWNLPG